MRRQSRANGLGHLSLFVACRVADPFLCVRPCPGISRPFFEPFLYVPLTTFPPDRLARLSGYLEVANGLYERAREWV